MSDFMKLYSGLVEKCFTACAQDFTSKALTTNEVSGRLGCAGNGRDKRGSGGAEAVEKTTWI
jgi:hypothetical protein